MTKKIIFTAGGTGGHIFPAINLMQHFFDKGYKVVLVTDKRGKNFIKNFSEFKLYILKAGTPTNKNFIKKILSLLLIFFSILRSIFILKKENPDLIIGFGGYVSFPISFASKLFGLPLVIYESNMILGRANKHLSFFAKKILTAKDNIKKFPKKYENKTYKVGSIINKNIINYSSSKKDYDKESFTILILGGSQGAEIFGSTVPKVIEMLKENGFKIEIIQQCISGQKNTIEDFYNKNNIKNYVFEFNSNLLDLISSSDIAITRCGASSTAELTCSLTPFIAVPLPDSIDDHQSLNAKYYEDKGCCWILNQENFNTENLFNLIINTIKNKKNLENVRDNMKKNCNKNVYSYIENQIKEFL